ncbi:MAG: FtsQ-type POTRA domain-containing protein [Eggerthellaceae bacterium]|nr:FtsQ-type POTRA domain-containing protein [Eggerthellaceae bacterium]
MRQANAGRTQPGSRSRSHGSSRPASPSYQGSYTRQAPRATTRQANSLSRQRADARQQAFSATRTTRSSRVRGSKEETEYASTSVGELRRADRMKRAKQSSRQHFLRIGVIAAVVVALIVGGVALYNSPLFAIANVEVKGVEHLTSDEMAQLANVPKDTTLLRVDTATIEKRIEQNAWVADAQVNRVFPDTLEINVTERGVFAVVEVPTSAGASIKRWAIASDHMWLMPIPDANSDAAKTTSSKIYEDAASALHIVDVPYGTKAEIGQVCTDANVNNALDVVSGLTTELAGRVTQVSAAGTAETTLVLDNGVEVAFGKAEDIRDKERVILQILADNEDNVAYINVRMVETPTWRAV